MNTIKTKLPGLLVCFTIAVPSWYFGRLFPTIGGPVIAIILGMLITLVWKEKASAATGIAFTSKYILQAAVVLLGFGLNLNVILRTGSQSLPIIICTIGASLLVALLMHRFLKISDNSAILVGVGSSICGGSAIAATAPVIKAHDDEVAQSIAVIFFFNVLAALLFPALGYYLGLDTTTGEAFGIFAGTAVNDTSSVTAAASTWDSMFTLGTATLDKAVTVKLTRTLAIIPITLVLAYLTAKRSTSNANDNFKLQNAFPMFIFYFVLASIVTTILTNLGVSATAFAPLKELSKFFIIVAMAAIGLNSNLIKLVKTGSRPLLLGGMCWLAITVVSLTLQYTLGLW